MQGIFYINNGDYTAWMQAVQSGVKPWVMAVRPRPRHALFKALAEGMEQGGLDLADLGKNFGVPVQDSCQPLQRQWHDVGLENWEEGRLVLTLAGQFWQVNLSQLLQEYLEMQLENAEHETA